ncbi:MAG: hypothetical protein P8P30_01245 [Rickettsiales bacterium]|nr:hypothetical protein [Rickettsiales bacterium]
MNSQNTEIEAKSNLFADNLRRVVGASYVVADGAYGARSLILAHGYKEEMKAITDKNSKRYKELDVARKGEIKEVAGMGLWAAGGITMALFGNRSTAKEMKALSNKLAAYLKDEGVNLEGDALARAMEEKNKNLFDKVTDFAYRFPSEIMHTCFAVGSVGVIANGIGKDGKKNNIGTLGMGVSVLIGALIGIFVPEKTAEQIAKMPPARTKLEQAGRFLQQHANKATSGLYLANNGFSAKRVMDDKKDFSEKNWKGTAKQSTAFHNVWQVRAGALATYLFGASVLGLTSKESGTGKKGDDAKDGIIQEAASMLANLPKAEQTELIERTSRYLIQNRELGFSQMNTEEVVDKITQALSQEAKADNWVDRSNQAPAGTDRTV